MMSIFKRAILFAICVCCMLPFSAFADKRVALLIGNGQYLAASRLINPKNDVDLIRITFLHAGFDDVQTATDLDRSGLIAALRAFQLKSQDADISVVYYSGHGMEMNGENYLIPTDAKLLTDRDVTDETIPLDRVIAAMDGTRRLKLVILDACRDNPFLTTMNRQMSTRSILRGLSRVEPIANTLVAFAAKAGTTALDGEGSNSPFAAALAKRLIEPGIDVQFALREVRDDVLTATNDKQEPFAYGSLGGDLIPITKASAPLPTAAAVALAPVTLPIATDPCQLAAAHWADAKAANKVEFYEEHLKLFGSCPFAGFAKAALQKLQDSPGVNSTLPAIKTKPVKLAATPTQKPAAYIAPRKTFVRMSTLPKPRIRPSRSIEPVASPGPAAPTVPHRFLGNIPFSGGA